MTLRQSVFFHLFVGGSQSVDSFTVPGEFVNEGQCVQTELVWIQEVHLTDLGGCLDPIETTFFGTVKALFD